MTYFAALLAWLAVKDLPGTTTQKVDVFLDRWVEYEVNVFWILASLAIVALALALIVVIVSLISRSTWLAGFGLPLGCLGVALLVLPLAHLLMVWLVANMAGAYSPELGITNEVGFYGSLIFMALLGTG